MTDKPSDASSALDTLRARELYKYFKPPPGSKALGEWTAAPDPTLTSFVQLVTWRLDCPRALVSLIDDDTQYFIAESSKTMNLENQRRETKHQHGKFPEDMLWARCTSAGKQGRLCAYTIETQAPPNGEPKCFEALDMSTDERFKNLPFVTGAPRWKYYCGVPLISKKGVAIGSLFALDDKPRKAIDLPTKEFLSTMGANVVTHLALLQERRERFVAMERSMCLASFVDPGHETREPSRGILPALRSNQVDPSEVWEKAFDEGSHSPTSSHSPEIGSAQHSQQPTAPDSAALETANDDEAEASSIGEAPNRTAYEEHQETFQRATELLHQALSLGYEGLVAILDSSSMLSQLKSPTESSFNSKYDGAHSSHGFRDDAPSPADVLAQKWTKPPVKDEIDTTGPPFSVLDSSFLTRLIKKYPRGKMFSIDRLVISNPGEESSKAVPRRKKAKSFRQDFSDLLQHFPGAKEIIFIPLWDSSSSRWSGLFVANTSEFRSLTYVPDFIYCVTFCECIMTELGRQAVMAADKQKSDFIGSVSHELRSPLHGILASMEFLSETKCDSFQQSLVQTADSCARTLLDTISMVLDYSKINSFERDASKARKSRRDQGSMQAHMNIYGNVNLAALTEEVVVGVATGQAFRDLNNLDAGDMSSAMPLNPSSPVKTTGIEAGGLDELSHDPTKPPPVEIIVDISPHDWSFVTQPGAFRRIVMNLFGNALKYTPSGHIKVKLAVSNNNPNSPTAELQPKELPSIVTLTVSDTGKGISPEYMRTNLFTPFSQESSLNPGTGLGLSLVRALVTMLGGDINIESVVGEGTEVVVKLPMTRNSPDGESSTSTPVSTGTVVTERFREDSIRALQNMMLGHHITFFQPQQTATSQYASPHAASTMQAALQTFLKDWFQMSDFTTSKMPSEEASLVILEEANLEAFTTAYPSTKTLKPALMVLCPISAKPRSLVAYPGFNAIEYISKPFGPYKLARALRSCIENWQRASAGQPTTPSADASAVGGDPEDISPSPQVEQVMISHLDDESQQAGISVLKQGATLGREESMNAQMALLSLSTEPSLTDDSAGLAEYPFPGPESSSSSISTLKTAGAKADSTETLKPKSPSNHPSSAALQRIPSSPPARPLLSSRHSHTSNPSSPVGTAMSPGITATSASGSALTAGSPARLTRVPSGQSRPPRVLLVDDNKINVRLLSTYLRGKRSLSDLHTAGDGAVAVALFKSLLHASPPQAPDIIFMDITMPVLDGFEATREIRALEAEYVKTLPATATPAPSLIIALTGLASGRDQMEAFTSGIDLYMTKPVSFKEVGRLLDNWTANGGASAGETLPHGPVTGDVESQTSALK